VPESAQEAKRFVEGLWELTSRLARRDIVVASLLCDWGTFGSWTVEAQRAEDADRYGVGLLAERWDTPGPHVLRATWDGKERLLMIESAPTPPLSSPGPWTTEVEKFLDDSEAAMRFVEEYLERWANGAGRAN
jgi:hypothetical protein